MHDANTRGTAVWIHRVLTTVSRRVGAGFPADVAGLARFRNLFAHLLALSLHVYGNELERFRVFDRDAAGRLDCVERGATHEPSLT